MEKHDTLVSICTPCYNHELYLDDFFKGIISQDYRPLQLVIIDDGSSDDSVKVINDNIPALRNSDIDVIFLVHEQNIGITRTCNDLIVNSTGKYIKFLASDDMLVPDCISEMMKYVDQNPDTMALIANTCSVENDYHYGDPYIDEGLMDIDKLKKIDNIHEKLYESCFLNSPGEFYNRAIFDKYGMFDENLYFEDWDFLIRISKGDKIELLDKVLVLYRKSRTSISHYSDDRYSDESRTKLEKMYLGTRDLFRKHKGDISEEKWRECFVHRYRIYLDDADSHRHYKLVKMIFNDMKEDGLNCFTIRQKAAYLIKLKCPGLFKLIKKVI